MTRPMGDEARIPRGGPFSRRCCCFLSKYRVAVEPGSLPRWPREERELREPELSSPRPNGSKPTVKPRAMVARLGQCPTGPDGVCLSSRGRLLVFQAPCSLSGWNLSEADGSPQSQCVFEVWVPNLCRKNRVWGCCSITQRSTLARALSSLPSHFLGPSPLPSWGQRKSAQFRTILDLGSFFYKAIGEHPFTLHCCPESGDGITATLKRARKNGCQDSLPQHLSCVCVCG